MAITVAGRRLQPAGMRQVGGTMREAYILESHGHTYEFIPLADERYLVTRYGSDDRDVFDSLGQAVAFVNECEHRQGLRTH